jgi:HTH-type transcriptional regulator/antitoxin HigA
MPTILDHDAKEEYLALVRAFPLVSIRDDAHRAQSLQVIDRLIEKPTRSAAEEEYLSALTDLVETYENAHVAIPPTTGVEALRYLMAENGLSQADLVPIIGTPSVVSEVLSGKRGLALTHIKKLAAHFGVATDTFIQ